MKKKTSPTDVFIVFGISLLALSWYFFNSSINFDAQVTANLLRSELSSDELLNAQISNLTYFQRNKWALEIASSDSTQQEEYSQSLRNRILHNDGYFLQEWLNGCNRLINLVSDTTLANSFKDTTHSLYEQTIIQENDEGNPEMDGLPGSLFLQIKAIEQRILVTFSQEQSLLLDAKRISQTRGISCFLAGFVLMLLAIYLKNR